MKLIIIEGGDRLGKSTLIEALCKHYDFENVCVRHFGKPPKGLTPEEFTEYQINAFESEAELVDQIRMLDDLPHYYDSVVIWNRSHLGEYVYSQMFRGGVVIELKNMIEYFEVFNLHVDTKEIHLITLTANPAFFHSKEDGNSFSKSMDDKRKELELFKEIHDLSKIKNKLFLKVDENNAFRDKDEILNEVLNFIEQPRKYAPGVYHGHDGDPLWKYKKL